MGRLFMASRSWSQCAIFNGDRKRRYPERILDLGTKIFTGTALLRWRVLTLCKIQSLDSHASEVGDGLFSQPKVQEKNIALFLCHWRSSCMCPLPIQNGSTKLPGYEFVLTFFPWGLTEWSGFARRTRWIAFFFQPGEMYLAVSGRSWHLWRVDHATNS